MEQTTEMLRDYVQALEFECRTHCWLVGWAQRNGLRDTEEYAWWAQQAVEHRAAYEAAQETMREMYPDGYEFPGFQRPEGFGDQLARLFPREKREAMHMGGTHAKSVTMQVTEDCNMACTYCYQNAKTHARMSLDTAKRFIDYLLEGGDPYVNDDSDGLILDFIGGEPFLEIGLIRQVADYYLRRCFQLKHRWGTRFMFCFSSNGLLYFQPEVQEFLDEYGMHVSLSISVDGDQTLHDACRVDLAGEGTYDRAMAAVRHYRDVRGGKIGSKMTIAPGNVAYVCQAVRSMVGNGYDLIHLNCVYEEGWTLEHARTLYRQLVELADYLAALPQRPYVSIFDRMIGHPMPEEDNKNWCGGTGLMLAVDWRGDLYPCLRYMASSLGGKREPYAIGDIERGVCNRERLDCLAKITRRSQSTDECFHCPIASGCSWCSAYNYECFGTPDKRATYICVMHRARVLANEYYWSLLGEDYAVEMPRQWREEIVHVQDPGGQDQQDQGQS